MKKFKNISKNMVSCTVVALVLAFAILLVKKVLFHGLSTFHYFSLDAIKTEKMTRKKTFFTNRMANAKTRATTVQETMFLLIFLNFFIGSNVKLKFYFPNDVWRTNTYEFQEASSMQCNMYEL
jgi:hypothetical protein